jgi:hypothetical protein
MARIEPVEREQTTGKAHRSLRDIGGRSGR